MCKSRAKKGAERGGTASGWIGTVPGKSTVLSGMAHFEKDCWGFGCGPASDLANDLIVITIVPVDSHVFIVCVRQKRLRAGDLGRALPRQLSNIRTS